MSNAQSANPHCVKRVIIMKFLRIRCKNFRLLRDLELEFSTLPEQPLTVIRAENETGKTTLLHALQWVLFGDEALPGRGSIGFRLHPIDWDITDSASVEIEVELEFEHTWERQDKNGEWFQTKEVFIAYRRTIETIHGTNNFTRQSPNFDLLKITENGHQPIKNPQDYLKQILGSNLKDLFFTDGDRALTFISSEFSTGEKRKLVKRAIRDMLSLDILESAKGHLEKTVAYFRDQVKEFSESEKLEELNEAITNKENEIASTKKRSEEIEEKLSQIQVDIRTIEQKLEVALAKGDKGQIIRDIRIKQKRLERFRKDSEKKRDEHSDLFSSESLHYHLLKDQIVKAQNLLTQLKEKGRIPRTSIPVLKERLEIGVCICGEKLTPGDNHYDHIIQLIKEQEAESEVDDRLNTLRIISSQKLTDLNSPDQDWKTSIRNVIEQRNKLEKEISEVEAELKELENKLKQIPETNIDLLRNQRNNFRTLKDNLIREQGIKESDLQRFKKELKTLGEKYDKLLREQDKANEVKSRLIATNDVLTVINNSYGTVQKIEIPEVSKLMNHYFLEMIRSDPEQHSIIREASVTPEYDIAVYGPKEKNLDPDRDLNGASRRALTLSFIFALTKVSGVKAPNVIDTPLGMMDPLIKQSVLRTLVRNSEQLILFLTKAEVKDCEELIDEFAGKVVTLTNSTHYPTMLVNDPQVSFTRVLKCNCNHRQYCKICERIADRNNPNLSERN